MQGAVLVYFITTTLLEGIHTVTVCSMFMKGLAWNAANKLEWKVAEQGGLLQNLFWQSLPLFSLRDSVCLKLAFIRVCCLRGCFRYFFQMLINTGGKYLQKGLLYLSRLQCRNGNTCLHKNIFIYTVLQKVAKLKMYGRAQSKELC